MPRRRRPAKADRPPSRTVGARTPEAPGPRALHYKVVELSTVDEGALERALNEWVPQGWTFDGVQFAMRESSKRPSMAFVFFTREGAPLQPSSPLTAAEFRPTEEAQGHLKRLSQAEVRERPSDPWARLRALAGEPTGEGEP
jgi:hypothetical protein